ncbi:MAG: [Fe-Fe] hydrogenase large subunit C-terminal domain-containing protein [Firmicutes bacterium]|nr:[Fe-Fe] hydrogenase large subunit C-terminal domain-containing protein [Bacillota bacterium]
MDCLTLKKSNCVDCHKCIRHCPVKSIRFSGGQAHIMNDHCILCGHCFVVCPQDAKQIVSEVEKVKVMLQGDDPVIVSLAPSFIANYNDVGIKAMRTALQKLGFTDVEETALGATMVKKDYEQLALQGTQSVIITSCCTSVNLLIQKYYPDLIDCLAPTLTPMRAHCADIKKRIPNARTVFIGPCVAKKDEGQRSRDLVDAVLTFEELSEWLKEENIEIVLDYDDDDETRARIFPTATGVLKSMSREIRHKTKYRYMSIDGVNNCIAALEDIRTGDIKDFFIEMNACPNSCIGGPVFEKYHKSPILNYASVVNYAGHQDFPVTDSSWSDLRTIFDDLSENDIMPTEEQIKEIMGKMGKVTPEDELNCGTCGYETCREKAIAVFQGKAEVDMCLPYLKKKTESFSNVIMNTMPNGLVVVNEQFEIQQINPAAAKMMNIRPSMDVTGEHIVNLLSPEIFYQALERKKPVERTEYLAEYEKYFNLVAFYNEPTAMIFCILRDVTAEAEEKERRVDIVRQTSEIADNVVDKQMRIVQEIASLLGETAAETKIALTKLKESINE